MCFLVAWNFYLGWINKIGEQHFLWMKTYRFYPCLELQGIRFLFKSKNPCLLSCCRMRLYLSFCYLKKSSWDVIILDRTKIKSTTATHNMTQSYPSGLFWFVCFLLRQYAKNILQININLIFCNHIKKAVFEKIKWVLPKQYSF